MYLSNPAISQSEDTFCIIFDNSPHSKSAKAQKNLIIISICVNYHNEIILYDQHPIHIYNICANYEERIMRETTNRK